MPHVRSTAPAWAPANCTRHRRKHAPCFSDIYNVPLPTISDGKFELYSIACYEQPWLSYAGDYKDAHTREYVGLRHYFVDDTLAVAVTTSDERRFVTFYHEHFDLPHGVRPPRHASTGQRQLEYKQAVDRDIASRKLQSYKSLK